MTLGLEETTPWEESHRTTPSLRMPRILLHQHPRSDPVGLTSKQLGRTRSYQSRLTVAKLVQHAVHFRLLQGHRILQGLDPLLGVIQGYPMTVQSLLHQRKLLIDVLVPGHQLRTYVLPCSSQSLGHLRLVDQEFLLVLQSHLIEPTSLL